MQSKPSFETQPACYAELVLVLPSSILARMMKPSLIGAKLRQVSMHKLADISLDGHGY